MSRWIVLSLVAALMLIVAACETDDTADDLDTQTDETVEMPADDTATDDADVTVPEDDDEVIGAPADDEDDAATDDDFDAIPDDDADAIPADDEAIPGDEGVDPEIAGPGDQPGFFFDISFEEAEDLTAFQLREPAELPEGLAFQSIVAIASPTATEEELEEEATTVVMMYATSASDDGESLGGLPVEFTQTTEPQMHEDLPEEVDPQTLEIGDREVIRITMTDQTGEEIVGYLWQDGDVYFSLAAILGEGISEGNLEEMIASIPSS